MNEHIKLAYWYSKKLKETKKGFSRYHVIVLPLTLFNSVIDPLD